MLESAVTVAAKARRSSESAIVAAMRRLDGGVPEAIEAFDAAFGGALKPDDHEHSMRVDGADLDASRLTWYFDVARRGSALTAELSAAFARLCDQLELPLSAAVRTWLTTRLPRSDDVLQLVEGIDAGDRARGVVLRKYLVFRRDPEDCVREVLEAAGVRQLPANVDPRRVSILGLEVDRTGVADVKLYFELERERLPRVMANFAELGPVLPGQVRSVMFQHCCKRPERQQLYLHGDGPSGLLQWLEQRPAFAQLVKRRAAMDAELKSDRLEPWIIAFPFRAGRADLDRGNVYFHLRPKAGAPKPEVERKFTVPLEWMQREDVLTDYTLVPYEPVAPLDGRLRTVNLLYESFALAGVEAEGARVVELLRTKLGPYRSVFGVKLRVPHELMGWELYFYDQKRVHADLSVERVAEILAPGVKVDAQPPAGLPWHMFSVEFGVPHLRAGAPAPVDLYVSTNPFQKGTDRSYKCRGASLEFENVYSFHHPQTGVDQWLYRLTHGVHYSPRRHSLAKLVPPELFEVGHICVANKRRADALYFSRLTHAQLLFGLRHFGVAGPLQVFLEKAAARFDHALWDLGIDFVAEGAELKVTKVGLYGSF